MYGKALHCPHAAQRGIDGFCAADSVSHFFGVVDQKSGGSVLDYFRQSA
jgi:hypothetical protein